MFGVLNLVEEIVVDKCFMVYKGCWARIMGE